MRRPSLAQPWDWYKNKVMKQKSEYKTVPLNAARSGDRGGVSF